MSWCSRDRPAHRLARAGVLERVVGRALGDPRAPARRRGAGAIEDPHGDPEAAPTSASRCASGIRQSSKTSSPVVERRCRFLLEPRHLEAGRVRLDEERGDARHGPPRGRSSRNRVEARHAGVRDEPLGAVEHPVVIVTAGGRAHRSGVGAGARPRSARRPAGSRPRRAAEATPRAASAYPASLSPSEPSSCTARMSPLVAQTLETSSMAIEREERALQVPPCSSAKKSPKTPASRKSSTTSQGTRASRRSRPRGGRSAVARACGRGRAARAARRSGLPGHARVYGAKSCSARQRLGGHEVLTSTILSAGTFARLAA